MANCFWDDYEGHRKLHLAHWHLICTKKKYEGLGVLNLKYLNLCLLGSWVKRFISDENKLWRVSLRKNDVKVIAFSILIRNRCPPFGKG
jgi:hypothetical protein